MTERPVRPVRRTVAGPVVLLAAVLGLAGCSSATEGDAPAASAAVTETTAHNMSSMPGMEGMDGMEGTDGMANMPGMSLTASGKVDCAQHMPGDLLTADQAMVVFDTQHVCLGYVTVVAGTTITWHNTDSVDHEVVITDDADREIDRFTVAADGSATAAVDTAGVYRYQLSAIESFVGTIEVQ